MAGITQGVPGWVRRHTEHVVRALAVVPAGRIAQAGHAGLGWASLNDFSGLWGLGAVPSCLG